MADAAVMAAPSSDLAAELDWLAECLRLRLAQYFDRERSRSPALPEAGPPAPAWPASSAYGSALAVHGVDGADRLLLALALAPLLRPSLLDVLHSRNDSTQRGFTEFGGLSTATSPAFVPTVETACFLLAGDDLERRLQVLQRLSPAGTLARSDLLQVSASESPLAGTLQPGAGFIAQALPTLLPLLDHGSPLPAQRVHTGLDWGDLVLPAPTLAQLDDIGLWLAHGDTLLGEWGLGRRIAPGFTSLFHGPPGTGKTLSACLLGRRCGREVWRVDLSRLVSKYIGETEKNLGRLFDVAETRGWILFFDEADALFGKRTGVSDAHDRYANQEVSYLLQRVEAYAGVVILASNLRHHIDEAFLRRFQSVVPFALPRPPERLRLWREGFPAAVQLERGVDLGRIAQQHELSGGTIMNVVRWCCLRAVGRGDTCIRAGDIDEGIRRELLKEGRTL
jgi:hypothetical protein